MSNKKKQQQETPEQRQIREAAEANAQLQRQVDLMRQQSELSRQQTSQITENLPRVSLERMGGAEEQAQRSQLARELMAQQQAGQRQLLAQQAKAGIRGGAAAAQQSRLQQQVAAQRAAQEEQGFLGRRMFNLEQAQREQFANTAAELARRQLMASLRGQELQAQAAKEFGQQQIQAANSGGKLICTELYRQGLMSEKIYKADQVFGRAVIINAPEVMIGYWTWAAPVVRLMRRSKTFTLVVSVIAKPWAKAMANKVHPEFPKNLIGSVMMVSGMAVCRLLGSIRVRIKAYGSN